MYNGISDFERIVGGKLYNPASIDIEKQHYCFVFGSFP